MEEVLIDHGCRAETLGSDGSGNGDRGEEGDEHHPRDDPKASHVAGNPSKKRRIERMPT